jgi:hypothetical protein
MTFETNNDNQNIERQKIQLVHVQIFYYQPEVKNIYKKNNTN